MAAIEPTNQAKHDALSHAEEGPHSPARLQSSLDPTLIEAHGRAILYQALNQGRAVCFLGSGVSMAYGRLTWRDLVEMLIARHLRLEKPRAGNQRAKQLLEALQLSSRSPGDDLQSGRYPAAFQYLEEYLKGADPGTEAAPNARVSDLLRREMRGLLYDDQGQAYKLVEGLVKSTEWPNTTRLNHWWDSIHLSPGVAKSGALRRQDVAFTRPQDAEINRLFSVDISDLWRWKGSISAESEAARASSTHLFCALAAALGYPQISESLRPDVPALLPASDRLVGSPVEPLHRYVLTALWQLVNPQVAHELLDNFLPEKKSSSNVSPMAEDQIVDTKPGSSVNRDIANAANSPKRRLRQVGIDPLKILHTDLRIARFITTNYDLEVERLLHHRGYEPSTLAENRRANGSTVSATGLGALAHDGVFRVDRATDLIDFAVATAGRKVHVMHLHGRATDDASMIVTEQDYLDQYLSDGSASEMVTDALDLTFTANTVLFVGSGMNEDDVLRPLRQFVNERRSRHDKSAIVLLAANGTLARQIEESIAYYSRYGVHTVHYGVGPWSRHDSEPIRWLATLFHLRGHLRALLKQFKEYSKNEIRLLLRAAVYGQLKDFDLLSRTASSRAVAKREMFEWGSRSDAPLQIKWPWFHSADVTSMSQSTGLSSDLNVLNGVLVFTNTLVGSVLGFELSRVWGLCVDSNAAEGPQDEAQHRREQVLSPLLQSAPTDPLVDTLAAFRRPLDAAIAALDGVENSLFGGALLIELNNTRRHWQETRVTARVLPTGRPTGGWGHSFPLEIPRDPDLPTEQGSPVDAAQIAPIQDATAGQSSPNSSDSQCADKKETEKFKVWVWSRHPIALRAPFYKAQETKDPATRDFGAPSSDRFFGAAPSFTFRCWYESLLGIRKASNAADLALAFDTAGRRVFVLLAPRGVGKGHFLEASKTSRRLGEFVRFSWPAEVNEEEVARRYAGFVFFNLSFSLEVTSAFDRLAMLLVFHAKEMFPAEINASIQAAFVSLEGRRVARLQVLMQLYAKNREHTTKRLYVAVSGFNTLFDERGLPKNAQLYRIVLALLGPDVQRAPIDFVLICTPAGLPFLFTHPRRHHRELSNSSLDGWRSLTRIELQHISPLTSSSHMKAEQRRSELIEALDVHTQNRKVRGRPTHHVKALSEIESPRKGTSQDYPGSAFLHVLQDAKASNTVAKYFPEVAIALALRCQFEGQEFETGNRWRSVQIENANCQFGEIQKAITEQANDYEHAAQLTGSIPNVFAHCARRLKDLLLDPVEDQPKDQRFNILDSFGEGLKAAQPSSEGGATKSVELTEDGWKLDSEFIHLAKLTGRNRFMLSLVCAVAAETGWSQTAQTALGTDRELHVGRICEWLDRLSAFFDADVSEARDDHMIGMALEEFQKLHEENRVPIMPREVSTSPMGEQLSTSNEALLRTPFGWRLQQQLLWHLALIGHPVEADVLASAPQIAAIAVQLLELEHGLEAKIGDGQRLAAADRINALVVQAMDTMVRRCLVFRLNAVDVASAEVTLCQSLLSPAGRASGQAVPIPAPSVTADLLHPEVAKTRHWRFAVHRFMQRAIFIGLHAPYVEQPSLDQEGLSLWVTQPDDLPRPSRESFDQLDTLLSDWIGLPSARRQWTNETAFQRAKANGGTLPVRMLHAAFGVVRTVFSVGVIARFHELDAEADQHPRVEGYFEQHRQKVEGLIKRAAELPGGSDPNASSVFYHEEIVWLYNECGLFYLVQGRLDLAAEQFELALLAAARLEGRTDRGALWCRIHLNLAVVDIERGLLREARRYLLEVRDVADENPILRVLAQGYLTLVEHYSGNFQLAIRQYKAVIEDLEGYGQSRSAAIFSRHLADLYRTQGPAEFAHAHQAIDRAIAAATKGGHEDVRRMAVLSRIRLLIKDPGHASADEIQASLDETEQYGHTMGMPRMLADVAYARAAHLLQLGETRYAATLARRAISLATANNLRLRQMTGLSLLSRIYQHRGLDTAAASIRRRALEMAEACDYANVRNVASPNKAGRHKPSTVHS
jgi:tetratricopeptide (TPR) repeat protein